jgi:hypothetical protein
MVYIRRPMGVEELTKAGFTVKQHWHGRWFRAEDAAGEYCFLRSNVGAWHCFYKFRGTGSGGDPKSAMTGGLGEVIDTSQQLAGYCWSVKNAPAELVHEFAGLQAAIASCTEE